MGAPARSVSGVGGTTTPMSTGPACVAAERAPRASQRAERGLGPPRGSVSGGWGTTTLMSIRPRVRRRERAPRACAHAERSAGPRARGGVRGLGTTTPDEILVRRGRGEREHAERPTRASGALGPLRGSVSGGWGDDDPDEHWPRVRRRERAPRASHASGAGPGAPARERVGGLGRQSPDEKCFRACAGAAVFLLAMAGYSAASIYYNPRRFPAATLGATSEYAPAEGACASTGSNPTDQRRARGCATAIGFTASTAGRSRPSFRSRDTVDRGRPGATVRLSVRRPGDPGLREVPVQLDPYRLPAEIERIPMTTTRLVALILLALYPLPFLIVASVVLVQRVHDRHAWVLALMFGGFIVSGLNVRNCRRSSTRRCAGPSRDVGAVRTRRAWSALLFFCQLPRAHVARSPAALVEGSLAWTSPSSPVQSSPVRCS